MNAQRFQGSLNIVAVFLVIALVSTGCGSTSSQTSTKSFTVGVINILPSMESVLSGFKAGLTEADYVEGKNVSYQYSGASEKPDSLQAAAAKLVEAKVDLILAITTPAVLAVKATGTTIPVVFAPINDPITINVAKSISEPGGNYTGVLSGSLDSLNESRRLEFLLKLAPNLKRLYVPYNPDDPAIATGLGILKKTAASLGIELLFKEIHSSAEAINAAKTIPAEAQAIWVFADAVSTSAATTFAEEAIKHRLPFCTPNSVGVQLGALMAFGSDFTAIGKQAARLATRIFAGTSPANLPIETPEFLLAINLKTAASIGLNISDDLLRQAKIIIRP